MLVELVNPLNILAVVCAINVSVRESFKLFSNCLDLFVNKI